MALADFVGTESWLIFDLIGADVSWVRRPPPWDGLQGYEDVKAVLLLTPQSEFALLQNVML